MECIAGVLEAIISSVDIAKNSVDYVAGEAGVNTLDPHWLRRIDAREKERELARGAA